MALKVPHRKGKIFLGQAKPMSTDPLAFLEMDAINSPGISNWNLGPRKIIHLSKPEYIKHVTQQNAGNYSKNRATRFLKFGVGNGLLTSEGDFWLKRRRAAQPIFHKKRIEGFATTMSTAIEETMQEWEKKRGTYFNAHHEMMTLTLDVISRTMISNPGIKEQAPKIGADVEYLLAKLMQRIRTIAPLPYWVPLNGHLEMKRRRAYLREITQQFIDERRASGKTGDDLLGMLMETSEGISQKEDDEQLKDELLTIFIAGHETTAVALSYMIYLLTQHPQVAQNLKDESAPLVANRPATLDDLSKLPYTKQVIQESMRLYPPAWLFGRESLKEDEIDGYRIPPKHNLFVSPWAMHRHPDYWDDPNEFRPDRFTEEKAKQYDKFVYMPFGAGVRFCIGNNFAMMEMQITLATMAARFNFELKPGFVLKLDPLITLRPKNGVHVKIT